MNITGDHSNVQTMDAEGQRLLREFELSDVAPSEMEWTENYIAGEMDSNLDLIDKSGKLLPVIYKLFDIPMEEFMDGRNPVRAFYTFFFQSLASKVDVGSATNDGWVLGMVLELYGAYAKQNNYSYEVNGHAIQMIRLTRAKFFGYHSAYIVGLQDFVVSAIKHSDQGSSNFENLFLKNMAEEGNRKKVFSLFVDHLRLTPTQANDILRIIAWAKTTGILSSCSSFLRLYNKGTEPRTDEQKAFLQQHDDFIQKNSYFGRLMKPIYDVVQHDKEHKGQATSRLDKELEAELKKLNLI